MREPICGYLVNEVLNQHKFQDDMGFTRVSPIREKDMRKRGDDRMMPAALCICLIFLLSACGASAPVTRTAAPVPAKPKPLNDAFANFGGKNTDAGKKFRMDHDPVGIKSLRTVIKLKRTSWTVFEDGNGKEVKEATAYIMVNRGNQAKLIKMEVNDVKKVLGLTLQLYKAGETYNKARADWFPYVILKVY